MGTHELIHDVINEGKSDGNSEILTIGCSEGVILVCLYSAILGLADFSKLGEEIGFNWIEG